MYSGCSRVDVLVCWNVDIFARMRFECHRAARNQVGEICCTFEELVLFYLVCLGFVLFCGVFVLSRLISSRFVSFRLVCLLVCVFF